ncbi:toxin HigB-2 [mine drainage metagenome]|uniref:Toxin HigB-2 n=1 Tax=mine drainage metagenome TaxID=410659 RepID=A0A1J5RVI6_9ZZZZ
MSYNVIASGRFQKEMKRLVKKYPSLKNEYAVLIDSLETNPVQGIALHHNCYKIRISIASKGKGKSGGARVITNVFIKGKTVYLLTIYDKSEMENISDKELLELLKEI